MEVRITKKYKLDIDNIPEELKEEEEIIMALQEMVNAANDPHVQEILEMREKAKHDEASRLYQAERKGKLEIAKNMLNENMTVEIIAKLTGLSVEEINKLKNG